MLFEKQRLIILDFDHTVFNTTKLVATLKKKFQKEFGISEETFMAHRDAVKEYCRVIDIDTFVEAIPYEDTTALHAAMEEILGECSKEYIFNDVFAFLERHRDRFDILIETHGDQELQTKKITNAGLPPYVEHLISLDPKDVVVGQYKKHYTDIHFIDDKAENIDRVKQAHEDVTTYFIKRPDDMPYGNRASSCRCNDVTISDLTFDIDTITHTV